MEDIIQEINYVLSTFAKTIDVNNFTAPEFLKGDSPDKDFYYNLFQDILRDLTAIFSEIDNLEQKTLEVFNYSVTESDKLISSVKKLSTKINDLAPASKTFIQNLIYFTESFNDLNRIESDQTLINTDICEFDLNQGIATLSIDLTKSSSVEISNLPVINTSSNGVLGNNEEIGAINKNQLKDIIDNNGDTWIEYEKVTNPASSDKEPLVLDISMVLNEPKIVNFIRINPYFLSDNPVSIETIETSIDGKIFTSIKDDLPDTAIVEASFSDEFALSPQSSKSTGESHFSFTPRKAKYFHFIFKQAIPYPINTSEGIKNRYAIGLRDIELRGYQYLSESEFISIPFESIYEIKKVSLKTGQYPAENTNTVSIDYFISPDNGQTWLPIFPEKGAVLFNTYEASAIKTPVPVYSIRLKAIFTRNDDAFSDNSDLFKIKENTTELHSIELETPIQLELQETPIKESIQIIEPFFGSVGKPTNRYILGSGQTEYILPFTIPEITDSVYDENDKWKKTLLSVSDIMHVYVGNEEWTHATKALSDYAAAYSTNPEYRLYIYDRTNNSIKFGSGYDTMQPPEDALISIYFEEEKLLIEKDENGTLFAKTNFLCTNDRNKITLKYISQENETKDIYITPGLGVIDLGVQNITDITVLTVKLGTDLSKTQKDFLNGSSELTVSTDWSIDTLNGKLYLKTPIDETTTEGQRRTHVQYQQIDIVPQTDWEIFNKDNQTYISFKEASYRTSRFIKLIDADEVGKQIIPLNVSNLDSNIKLTVDKRNVTWIASEDAFRIEVPFIDGKKEFINRAQYQNVSKNFPGSTSYTTNASGVFSVTLDGSVVNDVDYPISIACQDVRWRTFFENGTRVYVTPTVAGQWSLNLTTKVLSIKTAYTSATTFAIPWGMTVSYTIDANYRPPRGAYSIDRQRGIIYTDRVIASIAAGERVEISGYHSNYFIDYDIVRNIPSSDWKYNVEENIIELLPNEVLNQKLTVKDDNYKLFYQVNYDFVKELPDYIEEIRPYFTPVLKDYELKVKIKGR